MPQYIVVSLFRQVLITAVYVCLRRQAQAQLEADGKRCDFRHGGKLRRVVLELPEGLFLCLGQCFSQLFLVTCSELQDVRIFAGSAEAPLRQGNVAIV